MTRSLLLTILGLLLSVGVLFAQPNISYTTPVTLELNIAVGTTPNPSLNVTNSGTAVVTTFGYSNTSTQPLTGATFNNPARGAVDAAGNIYVANFTGNTIFKYTSTGTLVSNNFTSGASLASPGEIVFDSSGNLWVLNSGALLQKYSSSGVFLTSYTITGGSTTLGLAIDAADVMYVTSSGNSTIYKITPALSQSTFISSGLNAPVEVALDASNNVYTLNQGSNVITVHSSAGTSLATSFTTIATATASGTYGLAVDAVNAYVYVADNNTNTIKVFNTGTTNTATVLATITGTADCRGVFVDQKGFVYAPDYTANTVPRYRPTGQYFINKKLPIGLSISKTTGAITGTATVVTAAANYVIGAYNATGGDDFTINLSTVQNAPVISYTTPQSYVVNTAISTLTPTSNTAGLVGAFGYNAGVSLTGGTLNAPWGIAEDASGNIYVANSGANNILKYSSAGAYIGIYGTGGSLATPTGLVFDSNGNMYVLSLSSKVSKYDASGAFMSDIITSGLNTASGIAIDASNILYITSYSGVVTSSYKILKYTTAGAAQTALASTNRLKQAVGVALNNLGDVYATTINGNSIGKYLLSGNSYSDFVTGLTAPYGIDVNGSNNVYSQATSGIVRVYNAAATQVGSNITSNISNPRGIHVDSKGIMYVTSFSGNTLYKYTPMGGYFASKLPRGLAVNPTTGALTGTPTVASPATNYTITAYNAAGVASTTVTIDSYVQYAWDGGTSTAWATGSNWTPTGPPGQYDKAVIGIGTAYSALPTVPAGTTNVGSIVIGTSGSSTPTITLTNGATLNVAGDIKIQSDANSLTNNAYVAAFTTAGIATVNAVNFNMIANNTALNTYTLKASTNITNFNISGDISLTTTYNTATKVGNATFSILGGTVTATDLLTSNGANALSTATLSMSSGSRLNFTDPTALAGLSGNGTNTLSLTAGSTIGYTGTAAQTVYTNTAITGLPSGISYNGLAVGGTGIKTASSGTLNIAGDFTNTLTNDASNYLDVSAIPVAFNGGVAQALAGGSGNGTKLYTTTFSGGGTKTMSGLFNIESIGSLTLSGSTTLAANGALTLKSDANNTAYVATIPAGSAVSGNVNVERYISGGTSQSRGYRLLSSPVSVSSGSLIYPSLDFIKNGMYTTGTGGGTNGFNASGNPTIYLYREDIQPNFTSFISGNSRGVGKINSGSSFTIDTDGAGFNIFAGGGVLAFFRGPTNIANPTTTSTIATPSTLTSTGYLNQGDVVVKNWFTPVSSNLSYTSGTSATVRGYNLVGNPYASSIDWDLVWTGANQTGIDNKIYVYNPVLKCYSTYMAGFSGVGTSVNGTNDNSNILPSGQGFYVRTNATGATLTFKESQKVSTQKAASTTMLATGASSQPLKYLRIQVKQDEFNREDALVFFKPNASTNYIREEDAEYLRGNNTVGIATLTSDNARLAINSLAFPSAKALIIPLNLIISTSGPYKVELTDAVNIPTSYNIWLKDNFIRDSVDIRSNTSYNFNALTTDSTTYGNKRFSLVIRQDPAFVYKLVEFTATKAFATVELAWKTQNAAGNYAGYSIERSIDGGTTYQIIGTIPVNTSQNDYSFTDKSPKLKGESIYRLKQEGDNSATDYSNLVTINYSGLLNEITKDRVNVYPNPAKNNIGLLIYDTKNAQNISTDYTITIANSVGKTIKTIITTQPYSWQGDVSTYTPGVYLVKVVNNNTKTVVGNSKFVKL